MDTWTRQQVMALAAEAAPLLWLAMLVALLLARPAVRLLGLAALFRKARRAMAAVLATVAIRSPGSLKSSASSRKAAAR